LGKLKVLMRLPAGAFHKVGIANQQTGQTQLISLLTAYASNVPGMAQLTVSVLSYRAQRSR
jgi:hypothetical protein